MEELRKDDPGQCTEPSQPAPDAPYDITLLDESEGMARKIDECIRKETSDCIGREPSAFVKSTLQRARALVEVEKTNAGL
ncbi:hypothetical protein DOTSEDRAFT_68242 [Dothistroma septosporum NZE10]|uniref:Uncharacterized protein n=1 Tax=Dothistroma septosporum (strain NZE10 / CBS 128990) TaxID=675120 RepID=N1Q0U9_DOTSN|nr:hypothetical protein DOTSEDRAFT_68242 [Dothistroma septosporum NZE10]